MSCVHGPVCQATLGSRSHARHIDHSKPLAERGTYHPNDCHALHASQNLSKDDKLPYDWEGAALCGHEVVGNEEVAT